MLEAQIYIKKNKKNIFKTEKIGEEGGVVSQMGGLYPS